MEALRLSTQRTFPGLGSQARWPASTLRPSRCLWNSTFLLMTSVQTMVRAKTAMGWAGGPGAIGTNLLNTGCPRCLAFGHLGDLEPQPAFSPHRKKDETSKFLLSTSS